MTAMEHTPRPGATWEREVVAGLEVVVPEDDGSPFGWAEPDPRGHSVLRPGEGLNREQRRALDRRKRKGRA